MKVILKQNNVKILSHSLNLVFYCKECGAEFQSDEYQVVDDTIQDVCPTCKSLCIINMKEEVDFLLKKLMLKEDENKALFY
uniref:Uncharacterized protein n=1 Tax=Dictyoglomus turgidum TaxID=513050 RepID=A0A7C3SQ79_9BACT